MPLKLTVLGSSSALPAHGRFPSAQLLETENSAYLIDCGEGTQIRFLDFKLKKSKVVAIFVSHMHGDHIFGLPGLITSYGLEGRTKKLDIYGPCGLQEFIQQVLKLSHSFLKFEVNIHEVDASQSQIIFEDHNLSVSTIPLNHRIPTVGYLFRENPRRPKLNKEMVEQFDLSKDQIIALLNGEDIGIQANWFLPNKAPRSYAYISDTSFLPSIVDKIKDVGLLYHEATYDDDKQDLAKERFHSTAGQAATIAELCNAKKLIIGHFSSRYFSTESLLISARKIFKNTETVFDGFSTEV